MCASHVEVIRTDGKYTPQIINLQLPIEKQTNNYSTSEWEILKLPDGIFLRIVIRTSPLLLQ